MGDETDFLWLEYSQESPFVRAILEEELEREAEEREEEEGEPAEQIRVYEFDEQSISLGWRIYALAIVTFLNVLNFTQQYLLIVTIFGMANELEFGETQCQVINETLARDYLHDHNMTGDLDGLCSEIGRCAENSTLFLPDVCGIQYTGQGILFEILAGPIYLIVQGVTSIPLVGLIQRLSLRPPFVIGLFTILWTLCTFITAYVNDYWAIALLISSLLWTPLFITSIEHLSSHLYVIDYWAINTIGSIPPNSPPHTHLSILSIHLFGCHH
eukprot:XP_011682476.1 PREDICTED: uncharacterized protein LOC100893817 [Strongylocentrotus purpuratus]